MEYLIAIALVIVGVLLLIPSQSEAAKHRHPLRPHKWWRSDDGSVSVETALVFPVFIGLLVGFVSVVIVFLTGVDLQRSADTAARKIQTGEIAATLGDFRTAFCSALVMVDCNDRLTFEVTEPQDIGGSDQFVVFRATYVPPYSVLVREQTAIAATMTTSDCERFAQCIGITK